MSSAWFWLGATGWTAVLAGAFGRWRRESRRSAAEAAAVAELVAQLPDGAERVTLEELAVHDVIAICAPYAKVWRYAKVTMTEGIVMAQASTATGRTFNGLTIVVVGDFVYRLRRGGA